MFALVFRQYLDTPALTLGIAAIHAKQITSKYRRLITAGTGAHLEKHIAPIVRIFGQQQAVQLLFQLYQLRLAGRSVLFSHLTQIRVAVLEQAAGFLQVAFHAAPGFITFYRGLKLGVLLGIGPKTILIADHLGIAEQR